MVNQKFEVVTVTEYSEAIAAGLGRLMPQLDPDISDEPRPRKEIEDIISDSSRDQLIAVSARDLIIGKAYVRDLGEPGWSEGYLGGMVVDKDYRRKGVGRALLVAAFEWCQERGIPRIGWYSENDEFHSGAHKLYESEGAKVIAAHFEKELELPKAT